jgi:hypothetical protein
MATRLTGTYLSAPYNAAGDHDEYTVTIDQDGYVDPAGTMTVESIKFDWEGEGKSRIHPILTSTCVLNLIIDSTVFAFLNALVAAGEETFKLKIEKNGVLNWMGFILSDLVTQENKGYGSAPILEVRAVDGIGRMKSKDYVPAIEGKNTWKVHLLKLVDEIGLIDFGYANASDIILEWVFFWEEENTTVSLTTDDVLQYYRLDTRIYKYIDSNGEVKRANCYDVLKDFCTTLNCRFMWSEGRYTFVQINEYRYRSGAPTAAYYHTYTKDYTHAVSSDTQLATWTEESQTDNEWTAGTSDLVLLSGSLYKWFAPLNLVEVYYKHFDTQSLGPDWEWNEGYTSGETYSEINYVNGTARLRVRGQLNYRLDYTANFDYTHLRFAVRIQVGTYYLRRTAYFSPNAGFSFGQIEWTTTASDYEFYPNMITVDNQLYTMQFDIVTPLLPESGDLTMFVTLNEVHYWLGTIPSSLDYTEYWSFFNTQVEVLVGGTIEDNYLTKKYSVTNPTTTNSEKLQIDVLFGTGPTAAALGAVEVWGGLAWLTGEQWRMGQSGTYRDLGQLLGEEVMGSQKTPVKRFLAQLNGVYQAHHRYKHITLTGDEYYIFLGGSFDVNRHDWSGEWFLISRDTTGLVPNIGIIRDHAGPPPPTPPIVSPNGDLPSLPDTQGVTGFVIPDVAGTTTTTILTEGSTITTININAPATDLWNAGDDIIVMSPDGSVQVFELGADIEAGDTSITVVSTTVQTDFPAGSWIVTDPVSMYELALACRCTWLREIFRPDSGTSTVKITVNSGTPPTNTDSLFVFRSGIYQTYGASYDYVISGADLVFGLSFDLDSDGNKELVVVKFMI